MPGTERLLEALGDRLRLARLRRRLPAKQVAERAGMAQKTLRAVERGSPGATLGAYAAVLQVLQLEASLAQVAAVDALGRTLQDKALEERSTARRLPRVQRKSTASSRPVSQRDGNAAASARSAGVSSDDLLALLESSEAAHPAIRKPGHRRHRK
jgi:transcriptional regulator with XRE-family HTH domain